MEIGIKEMEDAFNKWMDNYINHPETFYREFESVVRHLEEKKAGEPLSYGERCTAYILNLIKEAKES